MENRQRLIAAAQLLLLLAVTTAAAAAAHRPPRYRTAAARDPAKLNVHIVCHSHDDSGWLKTVDQYYWGANNTIQVAGVQYILDTVVQALAANPDRKFIYSEMSFFERWWGQQDEDTRALVTRLVQDGQLEFVNGGYVQHDEATAHYVAMIDQTTRGHSFLKRTFGAIPRVGWQIDPFGHSSTQAGLLSAQVGFDALFFGRADYQDMEYRKGIRAMELVWRGSNSLEDADVFTSNFASGNYGPPEGFAYEWAAPPIMDDPHLDEYNVQERVDAFVEQCRALANVTRGNDIMLTIGSDFQFANAHLQYKNLDKLIHYANADGRLNAFHSTPTAYAAAKHGYDTKWPLKQDDFFPYADFPHSYWTGYFTSRAASKGFIRAATSYLQAARQLEAFMGRPELDAAGPTTDALEEAVSLLQHHDAVTGTEKEHVTCDYHRRLARSLAEAQALVNSALERLIRGQTRPGGSAAVGTSKDSPDTAAPSVVAAAKQDDTAHLAVSQRRLQDASSSSSSSAAAAAGGNPVDMPVPLHSCNWLNVSACNTTVRLSAAGKGVLLAAYNPLAWSREVPLRVPLNTSKTCAWKVTGPEGEEVASQLVGVAPGTWCLQQLLAGVNATCPATFGDVELAFIARLPPLGYSTFYLEPQPDAACTPSSSSTRDAQRSCGTGLHSTSSTAKTSGSSSAAKGEKYEKLDNGLVTLEFDTETGLLARVTAGGVSARLSTGFAWYNSSTDAEQPSGAYIFRWTFVCLGGWLGGWVGEAVDVQVKDGLCVKQAGVAAWLHAQAMLIHLLC
jgi:alpha-mannosidase